MILKEVRAEKIKDCRGLDTIQVIVSDGIKKGIGSAPSGTSKGKYEVKDFSDRGISYSVEFIDNLDIEGIEINKFEDFKKIEKLLKEIDGTNNWSKIGGNTVIALEFAILDLFKPVWNFLNDKAKKIPMPLGNCIGGGRHFKGKATDFQEFLVISPKAETFFDAKFANTKVYSLVGQELRKFSWFNNQRTSEGAWAPNISNLEALDLLSKVVDKASNSLGFEIRIGLDVAASEFFDGFNYVYNNFSKDVKKKILSRDKQIDFINNLIKEYDLYYVEDPLHEDDFDGFKDIRRGKCLIAGDDLISTNIERLKIGLNKLNSVIVKPNQIGSLIKTKEFVDFAIENKIMTIMSHRSGDTMDDKIADLAVAFNTPLVKFGIRNKERVVKLDRLTKIEREISKGL